MNHFYSRPSVAFFLGFVLPYFLVKINFVSPVGQLNDETEIIIWLSIASYSVGIFFCWVLSLIQKKNKRPAAIISLRDPSIVLACLGCWYLLGVICLFYEFYALGEIPMLSPDVESLRFNVQVNGYIHLIAVSLGIASSLLIVTAAFLNRGHAAIVFALGVSGFVFLALTGNRSDFMFSVAVLFIFFVLRRENFLGLQWVIAGVCFILVFIFLKFYREISYGVDYLEMIEGQLVGEPSILKYVFYPLYMTFTYGFVVLDWLVEAGLGAAEDGRYTFYAFYSLMPGEQMDFGVYKNQMLGIDFYAELTSTVISNFYVDFGVLGVSIGCFFLSISLGAGYSAAKSDRRFVLLYSLLYLHTLIFFYVYIYVYLLSLLHVLACFAYCWLFLSSSSPNSSSSLSVKRNKNWLGNGE